MKRLLLVSGILSWFNLVVWGFMIAYGLLVTAFTMNPGALIGIFILSSIVLHSYAALKLRKSVADPSVPLGNQTPTGIRLMGSFVLFLGVFWIGSGVVCLQNVEQMTRGLQEAMAGKMAQPIKDFDWRKMVIGIGIFALVAGLVCVANTILNFRLLRWYQFMKENID